MKVSRNPLSFIMDAVLVMFRVGLVVIRLLRTYVSPLSLVSG
jgi:hypothetical protein